MAKRGGFPGGGMPGNMANLMKQAQRMQRQMEEQQKELEAKEFTASAGGGAVEVTVSGKREVLGVKLAEEVVDPEDIEMLQDLIVAAVNEALRKAPEEVTIEHCLGQRFIATGMSDKHLTISGVPGKPARGTRTVAKVIYRDGTPLDEIKNVPAQE